MTYITTPTSLDQLSTSDATCGGEAVELRSSRALKGSCE